MHAQSLVVTTRTLEDAVSDALTQPRVSANPTVRDQGLSALSALGTLDALVAASSPLPVPETPSDGAVDEAIATLVGQLYDQRGLERDSVDERGLERVRPTGRARTVDGTVILPLTSEAGGVHNWRPVYRLLFDSLDRIAEKCERICARFDSELSESTVAWHIWENCSEMPRETRSAIRLQLSQQERLFHMYDRSPSDPGEFAEWTLEQLTDVQTES